MLFRPCRRGGKAPRKRGFGRMAGVVIRGALTLKRGVVGEAAMQTGSIQHARLAFRPIPPMAVLGVSWHGSVLSRW
jgi:hypothetical protein